MADRVHYHPGLIYSVGTQVVTEIEITKLRAGFETTGNRGRRRAVTHG